ncbi:Nucleic acid-binding protein [Corchorus olitorius]|uniref:Nucleic acid-binding protein n=1 Tax=Corchorus olitorius TaxID=93759 RepID=A0A1R3K507_9ROSI|nr:Nucleic acid-binding protein [Corchorus olitorius]
MFSSGCTQISALNSFPLVQVDLFGERKLSQLKDGGQRCFIVIRIARLWDSIIPPRNIFAGIDFLALDSEGFAMHGTIPSDLADDFRPQLQEGHVYKMRLLKGLMDFLDITFGLHHVIGVLGLVSDVQPIEVNNNQGSVDKREIFLTLLSGKQIRITVWDPKNRDLNITGMLRLGYKPILIAAGIYIKDNHGNKQINSCSATKFYLDLDIPQTFDLRKKLLHPPDLVVLIVICLLHMILGHVAEFFIGTLLMGCCNTRFHVDGKPIELLSSADLDNLRDFIYPDAKKVTIQELLYLNAAVIKGIKYKIQGQIIQFQTKHGWYYNYCQDCTYAVKHNPSGYTCTGKHGQTIPRMNLTGIDVSDLTVAEKMNTTEIPDVANSILNKSYEFVVGVSDQGYGPGLNLKIFHFGALKPELDAASSGVENSQPTTTPPNSVSPLVDGASKSAAKRMKTSSKDTPASAIAAPLSDVSAPDIVSAATPEKSPKAAGKRVKTCARKIDFQ